MSGRSLSQSTVQQADVQATSCFVLFETGICCVSQIQSKTQGLINPAVASQVLGSQGQASTQVQLDPLICKKV